MRVPPAGSRAAGQDRRQLWPGCHPMSRRAPAEPISARPALRSAGPGQGQELVHGCEAAGHLCLQGDLCQRRLVSRWHVYVFSPSDNRLGLCTGNRTTRKTPVPVERYEIKQMRGHFFSVS